MRKLTQEEFIRRAREVHGDKYDYSKVEYMNTRTNVCIICPIHGEFWITANEHIYQKQGCTRCGINRRKTLVFGFGVNDYDGNVYINKTFIPSYAHWRAMLSRCYYYGIPTYAGVTVCDEWLTFSNFKKWFDENYREGYVLDKDILIQGNRIYSPETCCFVPRLINSFLTNRGKKLNAEKNGVRKTKYGTFQARLRVNNKETCIGTFCSEEEAFNAYKLAKKERIRNVAEEAYAKGKIGENVRDALFKWEIKEY